MPLNSLLLAFYTILPMTVVGGISSTSGFSSWVFLEMNTLAFVMVLFISAPSSPKNSIYYFIIQSMGSLIFMAGLLGGSLLNILAMALLMKLGGFPFHSWYLYLLSTMSWTNFTFLSTIQKLIPLYVLGELGGVSPPAMSVLGGSLLSALSSAGETLLKKIMSVSSLFNLGWLILLAPQAPPFLLFFLSYSLSLVLLSLSLQSASKWDGSNSLVNSPNAHKQAPLLALTLLNMAGFPPMLGFWAKVAAVEALLSSAPALLATLLLGSVFILYLYMNFCLVIFSGPSMKARKWTGSPINFPISLVFILWLPVA